MRDSRIATNLVTYLVDSKQTRLIEVFRYNAQAHRDTFHRNDALNDGKCL
jgi:hypothetical protein